jgi:hypothetical protein
MSKIDTEENLRLLRQWCTDSHPEIYAALEELIAAGLLTCWLESAISPKTGEPTIQVRFSTVNQARGPKPESAGPGGGA